MSGNRSTITSSGDLIAAVPTMIGYIPTEALVLMFSTGKDLTLGVCLNLSRTTSGNVMIDINTAPVTGRGPDQNAVARLDSQMPLDDVLEEVLIQALAAHPDITRVFAVAVSATKNPEIAVTVKATALLHGIVADVTLWTATIAAGSRWECLCCDVDGGTVPDPRTTTVALTAAIDEGRVVYPDRAALVAVLAPLDAATLTRRARLLDGAGIPAAAHLTATSATALLDQAMTPTTPLDDDTVVALGAALADPGVLDHAVRYCLGTRAAAAEATWTALTRGLPGTHAARPACLVAICALLRGDGSLARVALDRAFAADPDTTLAPLLSHAVSIGIAPQIMRELLTD